MYTRKEGLTTFRQTVRGAMIAAAATVVAYLGVDVAQAGPDNPQVIAGNATFFYDGNQIFITAADGTIINYSSFNIGLNEIVQFIQPHELAAVLNRINSPTPTHIDGTLLANGLVYFVNPSGVVFGENAVVDVAGIFAAGGGISNEDFLAGHNHFTNINGDVINNGTIVGKQVHLIGEHVANHGMIAAENGIVTMVAGNDVILSEVGGQISVIIDGDSVTNGSQPYLGTSAPTDDGTPAVQNTGTIHADYGQVLLGAGDMVGYAIHNSGTVRAAGGDITFVAKDGLIYNDADGVVDVSVDNGQAGSINVRGPSVVNGGQLLADAHLSGQAGSINFTSQNHTYLLDGSLISASGGSGNAHGGDVLVHSYNGLTAFAPSAWIDISGGSSGGHGGFAEVSGSNLLFSGNVDLSASSGYSTGQLLIDPDIIRIVENGNPAHDLLLDDGQINFMEGPDEVLISASAIEAILGTIILEADEEIFVLFPIMLSGQDIILRAGDRILINAPILGAGNMTLHADFNNDGVGALQIRDNLEAAGDMDLFGSVIVLGFTGDSPVLTAGGVMTLHNLAELRTDVELNVGTVHFMDHAYSPNAGQGHLVINGDAVFHKNVGTTISTPGTFSKAIGSLLINGDTTLLGGLSYTTGNQTFNGSLTFDANLNSIRSLFGGDIMFNGSLVGPGVTLNVFTSGQAVFGGPVGQSGAALGRLFTDAGGTTHLSGPMYVDDADFDDAVHLDSNTSIVSAISTDFAQAITGNGNSLVIQSPFVRFGGNVSSMNLLQTHNNGADGLTIIGSQFGTLDLLTIDANSINLMHDVQLAVDSNLFAADDINIGGSLDGQFNLLADAGGQMTFGGDVGGSEALESIELAAGDLMLFEGNLVNAINNILLNPGGSADIPLIATIGATGGDFQIISMNGDITFGQNQKLTVTDGSLAMLAENGIITVGDLNAFGNIQLSADEIHVLLRDPSELLDEDGNVIVDEGVDFIAGGIIDFSTMPILIGQGGQPVFGSAADLFSNTLSGFTLLQKMQFSKDLFRLADGTILDLTVFPPTTPEPPTDDPELPSIAEFLPGPNRQLEDYVPLEPFALRPMDQFALNTRPMSDQELVRTTSGLILLDDLVDSPDADEAEMQTAANRLRRESVLAVLDAYAAVFNVDPTAEQVDEQQLAAARQEVRQTLADAWNAYAASVDGEPQAEGFRTWLALNPEMEDARAYCQGLREIVMQMRIMGATPREIERSLTHMLGPVTPDPLDRELLIRALTADVQIETTPEVEPEIG